MEYKEFSFIMICVVTFLIGGITLGSLLTTILRLKILSMREKRKTISFDRHSELHRLCFGEGKLKHYLFFLSMSVAFFCLQLYAAAYTFHDIDKKYIDCLISIVINSIIAFTSIILITDAVLILNDKRMTSVSFLLSPNKILRRTYELIYSILMGLYAHCIIILLVM